jgi:hypothetical protein
MSFFGREQLRTQSIHKHPIYFLGLGWQQAAPCLCTAECAWARSDQTIGTYGDARLSGARVVGSLCKISVA